jgi:hypothetical protein
MEMAPVIPVARILPDQAELPGGDFLLSLEPCPAPAGVPDFPSAAGSQPVLGVGSEALHYPPLNSALLPTIQAGQGDGLRGAVSSPDFSVFDAVDAAQDQAKAGAEHQANPDPAPAGPIQMAGPAARQAADEKRLSLIECAWLTSVYLPDASRPGGAAPPPAQLPPLSSALAAVRAPEAIPESPRFRHTEPAAEPIPAEPAGAALPPPPARADVPGGLVIRTLQFRLAGPLALRGPDAMHRDAAVRVERWLLPSNPASGLCVRVRARLDMAGRTPDPSLGPAASAPSPQRLCVRIETPVEFQPPLKVAALEDRRQRRLVPAPPAPRGRIRLTIETRDPGGAPLLDPLPCAFPGEED